MGIKFKTLKRRETEGKVLYLPGHEVELTLGDIYTMPEELILEFQDVFEPLDKTLAEPLLEKVAMLQLEYRAGGG